MLHLFETYPLLKEKLPYRSLLEFLLGDTLQASVEEVRAGGFPASCQAFAQAILRPTIWYQKPCDSEGFSPLF